MRKEKKITRTIASTHVDIMLCNTDTCEVFVRNYTLIGEYNSDKEITERITPYLTNDTVLVKIESVRYSYALYAISERDFVTHGSYIKTVTKLTEDEKAYIDNDIETTYDAVATFKEESEV